MSLRLSAHGLMHTFNPPTTLFENLDLEVHAGEVIALVGPSGSGKSTLMSIIAGWQKPVEGSVALHGVARIGWVFQNPHGVSARTALDHVVLPLIARGVPRKDAEIEARAILDLFDVGSVADRVFGALSGGEAQRLMLARAVAAAPDLLLVDEPTAQLDMHTAHTVNTVLASLATSGAAVVVATHDPDTRDACQRVVDLAQFQQVAA